MSNVSSLRQYVESKEKLRSYDKRLEDECKGFFSSKLIARVRAEAGDIVESESSSQVLFPELDFLSR